MAPLLNGIFIKKLENTMIKTVPVIAYVVISFLYSVPIIF